MTSTKTSDRRGWYKRRLQTPIPWIAVLGLPFDAPIIDVGSGAPTLVGDLLDAG